MTIRRLAQEAFFSEADIARSVSAYEAALQLLRLADRTDPVTEMVAKKMIEVYQSGERDPPRICARAIKELDIPLPD